MWKPTCENTKNEVLEYITKALEESKQDVISNQNGDYIDFTNATIMNKERLTMNTIKTKVVLHSPHVTMERNGDCIDLNFCGLHQVINEGSIMAHGWNGEYATFKKGKVDFDNEAGILKYSKGSIFKVKLGFSMEMPEGKRANVYQRSGTRKNFGVLLTNHVGIIDNAYNGTDDQWMAEFYAIEDGQMKLGDRILQFEIVDVMPKVEFDVVESFENENRGGFGSSGI